ncbi:MAG: phytoene desaturase [Bacteroidales bacterium]|nr:phytoene desaturase [Bacteroidales bacterium]
MGKGKKVIIIGAGIGGITTAIHLAQNKFDVRIYEKNDYAGGRCGNFTKDGHRFDIGATLLMMTDIYRETYASFGKELEKELELYRMDPIYRIKYINGQELNFTSDLASLQQQLESIEPGSYKNFLAYMAQSYSSYKLSMKHIIDRNYYKATDSFNLKNLILLLRLKAFNKHYEFTNKYFKNELLKIAFTFQNIYVGQNPFTASALFSMLPFLELTEGVWYPKGGMFRVIENLLEIAQEFGVTINYNKVAEKIQIENNKATGVRFTDSSCDTADIIISNADLPYVYNDLLPRTKQSTRVNKLKYTCSAFVFHWGMDKIYNNFEQHNVFVSRDYKENIVTLFKSKSLSDDPSFYIHAACKSDKTAAPVNQDSISAIVPAGHIDESNPKNWNSLKQQARDAIFRRFMEEGITDFEEHIKFEVCYTPQTWKTIFNLSRGATFGSLSHNLLQMGFMRPHNQHKKYKNLFFVGGSTHPGNGIPMALLSAKLSSEKIIKYYS